MLGSRMIHLRASPRLMTTNVTSVFTTLCKIANQNGSTDVVIWASGSDGTTGPIPR